MPSGTPKAQRLTEYREVFLRELLNGDRSEQDFSITARHQMNEMVRFGWIESVQRKGHCVYRISEAGRTQLWEMKGKPMPVINPPSPPDVIGEIAAERVGQIEREGYSLEHDDAHNDGELARAAAVYAEYAMDDGKHRSAKRYEAAKRAPGAWPWEAIYFKPKTRRRDLIRAAALIVAEIERLDRAAAKENG